MVNLATRAIESTACFSECKRFRFWLKRKFNSGEGSINFVMLNPSTADEFYNDPTVLRCELRAIAEGFKEMTVTNLFAFRATEPKDMKEFYKNKLTKEYFENLEHIEKIAENSKKIICAWGNDGAYLKTSEKVRDILKNHRHKIFYLKMNKSGEPQHPLYISPSLKATNWIF